MDKGIFDFKRKMAFVAALVFVSHTLYGAALAETSSAAAAVQASDMGDEANVGAPEPKEQAAGTDTADGAASNVTANADQPVTETYYFSVDNLVLDDDICSDIAKKIFGEGSSASLTGEHSFTVEAEAGKAPGDDLRFIAGERLYIREPSDGNSISLKAYGRVDLVELENDADISPVVREEDALYALIGSEVTLTLHGEYKFENQTENRIKAAVEADGAEFRKTSVKAEQHRFNIVVNGRFMNPYAVVSKSFTIGFAEADISLKIREGENYRDLKDGDSIAWSELDRILVHVEKPQSVALFIQSYGDRWTTFGAKGVPLIATGKSEGDLYEDIPLRDAIGGENFCNIDGSNLMFTAIQGDVTVETYFGGQFANSVPYSWWANNYTYKIPYIQKENYYLKSYKYGDDEEVQISFENEISPLFRDDSDEDAGGNGEEQFKSINLQYGKNKLVLRYEKLDLAESSYTYKPVKDVSRRSENCYSVDTDAVKITLMDKLSSGMSVYYNYENNNTFMSNSQRINRIGEFESNIMSDKVGSFIYVRDVVKKENGQYKRFMDNSICFYLDRNAPKASLKNTDGSDYRNSGVWKDKSDSSMELELLIDDKEKCLSSDEKTKNIYEKYINNTEADHPEIKSIVIGDYRFDRPADGWGSEEGIYGYVENESLRAAENTVKNDIREALDGKYSSRSDLFLHDGLSNGFSESVLTELGKKYDSLYNEKQELESKMEALSEDVAKHERRIEELKAEYSERMAAAEDTRESEELRIECKGLVEIINEEIIGINAEIRNVSGELEKKDAEASAAEDELKALEKHTEAYKQALEAPASKYHSVPSLKYENGKFIVTISASKEYENSEFKDELPVYAIDNSYNSGENESGKNAVIYFDYDAKAPSSEGEIKADEGSEIKEYIYDEASKKYVVKSGDVKRYILRNGTVISAVIKDGGSGVDDDTVFWEIGDIAYINRMFRSNGDIFSAVVNDGQLGDDRADMINISAKDRQGNIGRFSSLTNGKGTQFIVDRKAPECSIEAVSEAKYGDRWYADFSSIEMKLTARDIVPEGAEADVASGIKKLEFTVNGVRCDDIDLFANQLLPSRLKDGDYYLSFVQNGGEKSREFKVVLRDKKDENVAVYLTAGGSEIFTLGKGKSLKVELRAADHGDNHSGTSGSEVNVELESPEIYQIILNNSENIIRDGDDYDYKAFANSSAKLYLLLEGGTDSGIKEVKVTLRGENGEQSAKAVQSRDDAKIWVADIPADFRGTVSAVVTNTVERSSKAEKYTHGIITETYEHHKNTSGASIGLPPTDYTDISGKPLYNQKVIPGLGDGRNGINIDLSAQDSFAGLARVEVSVSGQNVSELDIDRQGVLHGDGWEKKGDDRNLVTAVSSGIEAGENRNGNVIHLTADDNAGNRTDKEAEFSIDTVAPEVRVTFDSDKSGDAENKDIFNTERTAVITVRERNFDAGRVNVTVNGVREDLEWTLSEGEAGTDQAVYRATRKFDKDGEYRLSVECTDRGALPSNKVEDQTFIIDRTAPVLNVGMNSSLANDHYYSQAVTLTLNISDDNFDQGRIDVSGTLNGSAEAFPKMSEWTKSGSTYTSSVLLNADGEYTLSVSGRDKAGNALEAYSNKFCIDTTKPKVVIDKIGSSNETEIRPHIIFSDRNLDRDSIQISLSGAQRGSGLPVEGQFSETDKGLEYILDNIPARQVYDDIYTLSASVKDSAENETETDLKFTVNRFGSRFEMEKATADIAGKYISKEQDIVFIEKNADQHSKDCGVFITKDSEIIELKAGRDYSVDYSGGNGEWSEYRYTIYAKNFESDAKYTVSIHSVDEAGNINISDSEKKKAELTFYMDKTKPLCIPLNISDNTTYKGERYTARFSVSDNISITKDNITVYLNGKSVRTTFEDDECSFVIPNSSHAQSIRIVLRDMADNEIEYTYKNVLVTTSVIRLMVRKTWFRFAGAGAVLLTGAGALFAVNRRRKRKYY